MKTTVLKSKIVNIGFLLIIVLTSYKVFSQEKVNENKTLSPYFFIQTDNPEIDQLPLKSTFAEVNIAGVIADVRVTQVYKNEGTSPIEAIYVFPGSTRAAVYGMKMTIGERTLIAKIEEREKARQDYEDAKQQGKSASLLEQQRPNVFQMSVANIMPGDEIKVELSYTELLIPDEGVYEFVYPTVVGPRYSNTPEDLASTDEMWVSNPYTHEGEQPFYTYDISIYLAAGLPVNGVVCTSHDVDVNFMRKDKVIIDLKDSEKHGGNRDFILKYLLKGDRIKTGVLLFEGEKENFFLAMIQPPKQVKPENIPPREYVFIVDVSGSMSGFSLDISKKLLKDLIGNLKPSDKFNVLLFAGVSNILSQRSLDANESNIRRAINFIDKQQGGGGTELLPALQRALSLQGTENYARTFIIATDGYVTVEKKTFDLIRDNLGKANFFTFGIGSSVDRYIIEGMAHLGKGIPYVITKQSEAKAMADKFRKYVENPVMTNIRVKYQGFDVYDIEPVEVPDVFSERPVLIFGKWKGNPEGIIELTGNSGNTCIHEKLDVKKFKAETSNSGIRYLWARERIRMLDDYTNLAQNDALVGEITQLGLKYNLLTAYTSFIAIDTEVRNSDGKTATVKQPLPLPQGVSDKAVGSNYIIGGVINKKGMPARSKGSGVLKEYSANLVDCSEIEMDNAEEEISVFIIVETAPEFIGGEKAFHEFLNKNIVFPEDAKQKGISGTVYVEFIIDTDGSVKDIKILRGIYPSLNNEAIRVIKLSNGKWKPGEQRGKPVKVKMVVPVKFEA